MMRVRHLGLLLAATAGLAGCGSTTTVVTDRNTASTPTTSATSSATATASTSTPSPTTSTVVSGTPVLRCTAATLALTVLGQQGAMGHGELGFALRNTGSRPCHTFGFPGVLFLTRSGAALPTVSERTTQDYFGTAPEAGVDLAPGQEASFRLGVEHGVTSDAGCTTAAALQVIPPDDTHTLRVLIPGGAYECGTATVSPLRPGTSAFG